jgi:hypothetical protein
VDHASTLRTILMNDPVRWRALWLVQSLELTDCWIGAGFVRNAAWDYLHGRRPGPLSGDVDVLWFDTGRAEPSEDRRLQAALRSLNPNLDWSVKNQARMHARNGDPPYVSTVEAMRRWPETATAVAARRTGPNHCEIIAPFGLDDLFDLVLRPTPTFIGAKHQAYRDRIESKGWLKTWPRLGMEAAIRGGSTP